MSPPEVHLPGERGTLRGGRAHPLPLMIPPADEAAAALAALDVLDVEKSARYQPIKRESHTSTYCNVYAHDVAHQVQRACGRQRHVPRVWWHDPHEADAFTPVIYGRRSAGATVGELGANALHRWALEWAESFGWEIRPYAGVPMRGASVRDGAEWLRDEVNARRHIGFIAARNCKGGSGHITVALPSPNNELLQSEAGGICRRLTTRSWWAASQFDAVVFAVGRV